MACAANMSDKNRNKKEVKIHRRVTSQITVDWERALKRQWVAAYGDKVEIRSSTLSVQSHYSVESPILRHEIVKADFEKSQYRFSANWCYADFWDILTFEGRTLKRTCGHCRSKDSALNIAGALLPKEEITARKVTFNKLYVAYPFIFKPQFHCTCPWLEAAHDRSDTCHCSLQTIPDCKNVRDLSCQPHFNHFSFC